MKAWHVALGFSVLLVLLFYQLSMPHAPTPKTVVRRDSVTIATHDIKRIQATEMALLARIKADSLSGVVKDIERDRQVAAIERRMMAIIRKNATPQALDSIRRALYPDGTVIDSTYAMSLRDARECLQAAERLPLAMALADTLKGVVIDLRVSDARSRGLFMALDSARVAENGQNQVIIRNLGEMLSDCQGKKKSFWRRAWGTVKDIGKVGVGFALGRL